jgi:hypothetical protein
VWRPITSTRNRNIYLRECRRVLDTGRQVICIVLQIVSGCELK